ncbi:Sec1-like family protein [Tieghemostelium lacteum]|uniref:Sec1-like family protein n=1 Tax=Tieghemostelium lacteum TaxID=361077 RepID=A0A151ZK32_TIELA|nr:Sec1-like family protein [Tieghemostelium lacteum]|eukprot:KYQ94306.1 Sec1-like family protein [Tieghemostelium lacteum]
MKGQKQPQQPQQGVAKKLPAQQQQQPGLKPIVLSQIPNISSKVLNLTSIREQSKRDLGEALDSLKGNKAFVMDPKLMGLLNLISDPAFLTSHGVEKRYELKKGRFDTDCKNIIYIVRPQIKYMHYITEHVRQHASENKRKEYAIVFVPRGTILCQRVLEEQGVLGNFVLHEFPLDIVPFDEDVLSLELSSAYREYLLDGDRTSLFYVAKSLMKLQSMFGTIPIVKGKGQCSRLVMDMITRMRKEMGEEVTVPPEIDSLILLDREIDPITPMCSQLTYEGLIDELFGINNNAVLLEDTIVNPPQTPPQSGGQSPPQAPQPPQPGQPVKKVPFPLHSNDKVYSEIRDTNFSVLSSHLNKKAKEIDEYYKKFKTTQSISAIRDHMKKLASYQTDHNSLRIHTCITEKILDITKSPSFLKRLEAEQNLLACVNTEQVEKFIEDSINKKDPFYKVIRMLILYNATCNGLKPKLWDFLKREIIQTYGSEQLITLHNMEKLGLLHKPDAKPTYPQIKKELGLIVEEINEQNPNDIAYTYSGYAPMSIRIIQNAIKPGGWKSIEDLLKLMPGPTFEEIQPLPQGATTNVKSERKPITLVYFIGGVTFSEISALRFLSRQDQANRDFIILTTKLINGESMIDSLLEQQDDDY